jgi:hypothetical protein
MKFEFQNVVMHIRGLLPYVGLSNDAIKKYLQARVDQFC